MTEEKPEPLRRLPRAQRREQILAAATEAFTRTGFAATSLDDIASQAGVTRVILYRHFDSKDDLIAAAVTRMFEESRARFREWTDGKSKPDALRAYINAYVSKEHRNRPENGCAIAALSSDIHRQGSKARAAYDAGITSLSNAIATLLPIEDDAKRRALSLSMLAEMTGAVAAARAVGDQTLSDEILASARRSLRARAGLPELHK